MKTSFSVNIHNKKLNKDKKQLAFCSLRSPILANNFLPVNWALANYQGSGVEAY
jgi:hypothetical protein